MRWVCSICIVIALSSCGWFDGIDKLKEKRMATYHWEGTLYKGYGEVVWANAPVYLEGQYPKGLAYERETIAEGTTDANGRFRLEYTIDSTDTRYDIPPDEQGMYEVRFQVGGGYPFMTAPWKVNVERDIAQNDHNKTVIIVNKGTSDSVYVCSGSSVVTASCQVGIYFPLYERNFQVSACSLAEETRIIEMVGSSVSTWDNSIKDGKIIAYGTTKSEVLKAFQSSRIDIVPNGYNNIPIDMRGFPYTDTVYLNL